MNINDSVYVRLTEHGERMWSDYWSLSHPGGVPASIRASDTLPDGRVRFQLHALMHIFGPATYNGSNKLPFESNEVWLKV